MHRRNKEVSRGSQGIDGGAQQLCNHPTRAVQGSQTRHIESRNDGDLLGLGARGHGEHPRQGINCHQRGIVRQFIAHHAGGRNAPQRWRRLGHRRARRRISLNDNRLGHKSEISVFSLLFVVQNHVVITVYKILFGQYQWSHGHRLFGAQLFFQIAVEAPVQVHAEAKLSAASLQPLMLRGKA